MPIDETPILMAQSGPLSGQQWVFADDLLVGRDASCDIIIPDRQVSRHHARFSMRVDGFFVEDLHSKNGTHLNGNEVESGAYLSDGDVVQIALVQEFVFISAESTVPLGSSSHLYLPARRKLFLDQRARRVWIGETELTPALSVSQFCVLKVLYNQEGRVVSRDRLTEEVWGGEGAVNVSGQALDALIRRLRNRLNDVDNQHKFILTVRGHGLRLDNPDR